MTQLISCPRVLTGTDDLGPGWVQVDGPLITQVGRGEPPRAADVRLDTGLLAPGLVDAQLNGAYGVDLAAADVAGWRRVATLLPQTGVTAFVPTFTTARLADLAASLRRYAAVRPEVDRLPGAARTLVAAGVRVAVGHSDADDATVQAAAEAGASLVTHLFNAQRPVHHREPGVVGAALSDERLTSGLIVDGHHVAACAVRIAFAAAPGRIMLVNDAVAAFGMPPGDYVLGGEPFTVSAGSEPPRRTDGTLAGAVGRLDEAIARAVDAGVPLQAAVEAATRVPADALGRSDLGRLAPGAAADLVWLAPSGRWPLRTRATWVAGRHGGWADGMIRADGMIVG